MIESLNQPMAAKETRRTNLKVYAASVGPFVRIEYADDRSEWLGMLEAWCPLPPAIVREWPVVNEVHGRKVEAMIHGLLALRRSFGEWFLCDLDSIDLAASKALEIPVRATWDEWDSTARLLAGVTLPRSGEQRRRLSARFRKDAVVFRRHRFLSDALVEWLVGFDPVRRRRESREERVRFERANKVRNRSQKGYGKGRPQGPGRRSKKKRRKGAGGYPTEIVDSRARVPISRIK